MAKATKEVRIEKLAQTQLRVTIEGDSPLILHGKSRRYLLSEIWKQSNEKGAKMPERFTNGKNYLEQVITSIHWEKPIVYHDDDITLYTMEELESYLNPENNRPCILGMAFKKSFIDGFIGFFKESTGKNGTDIKKALAVKQTCIPISFVTAEVKQTLVPTTGLGSTNVLASYLVFDGWKCEFDVSCVDIVFPYETVLSLINATGEFIGIGTQRANGYGRYHIGGAIKIE